MNEQLYIYYLTEQGGSLESHSLPLLIPRYLGLDCLCQMVDDKTATVVDMQRQTDEDLYKEYDYCVKLGGRTEDSELATKKYEPFDASDYHKKIKEKQSNIDKFLSESTRVYKQKKLDEQVKRDKIKFLEMIEVKAQAHTFERMHEKLEKQISPKVIAISTRKIGWNTEKTFNFPGELYCWFKSNFGYGSARYFYLIMRYKNVPILLYSEWVRYFYAKVCHVIRYTQTYQTIDSSWGKCFDLISEIHNSLKDGDYQFIQRWMVHEVEKMLTGLDEIANNRNKQFLVKNTNQIYTIEDTREFVRFKAEKLSGSLDFIKSIQSLSELSVNTDGYVTKIVSLNQEYYPEFVEEQKTLEKEESICSKELSLLKQKKKLCDKKLNKYKYKLNRIKRDYYRLHKKVMSDVEAQIYLENENESYKADIRALEELEHNILDKELSLQKSTSIKVQMDSYVEAIEKWIF